MSGKETASPARPAGTAAAPSESALKRDIEKVAKESGAKAIAVALHDFETGFELHCNADRWFHAASTIKVPILLGVIGPQSVNGTLRELHLDEGIDLKRGVEDELAFDKGINNLVTANGLLKILTMLAAGKAFSPALSRRMMDILHGQEFNQGIPARLPKGTRVAHKTGEISTVAHDAGVVYLPKRKPYALVILTEWDPSTSGRSRTIATISQIIYEALTKGPTDE